MTDPESRRRRTLLVAVGAGFGVGTVLTVLLTGFSALHPFSFGAIIAVASIAGIVSAASVGQYRSPIERPRAMVAVGVLGGALILLVLVAPLSAPGGPTTGDAITGTVVGDENDNLDSQPGIQSHDIRLERNERLRFTFTEDSSVTWTIRPPNESNSTRRPEIGPGHETVERRDGWFYYTANQTGTHTISIGAKPYSSGRYRIVIPDSSE